MEPYLLILLAAYPLIINRLTYFFPRTKFSSLLFIGPVGLLGLTAYTYFNGKHLDLTLWEFSNYLSLGFRLDTLSGLIATTVLTIGMIVVRFSERYLEDDPHKDRFLRQLAYTLSSVLAMLMAPNLGLLFLCWVGASYFLHQLLTHFSDRTGAKSAANQKFWISRLGDLFIVSAGVFLLWTFNSLNFETIFEMIKDPDFVTQNSLSINAASILIALGAMTKSAQYPFHTWLPNTMETPTPVSAIMHAGIINAGGYLVIRTSPLLSNAHASLLILALIGGLTAFLGTIAMFTQANIKKNLAYSTISQMGFMMLQCGLGAFSIAVVHIIGHAFYKAYAFLSSGTSTDYGRLNRYFPKVEQPQNLWAPIFAAATSLTLVFVSAAAFGYHFLDKPGVSVLMVILSLSMAQIFLGSKHKLKSVLAACSILSVYVALSFGMTQLLVDVTPSQVSYIDPFSTFTLLFSLVLFVALYLIQNGLEQISKTEIGKKIYVASLNGGIS